MNKYLILLLGILLTIPATLSLSAAETDIQWPIGDKTYEISIGAQVKTEAELQDGGFYVIYQPRNNCCIEEAADHKLMLNGLAYNALNGTTNTSYVLRLLKNNDGTWRIQTASGRYFPVPTGNQNLYSAEKAGNYSPNFNADGYIFPRITASGTTYGLDRASSGVYSYSTLNNTVGSAQCYQIFAVNLNEPNVIVHQGYQTVGRNSAKALLLRINIPGNNKNTTIDKICVTLKGNTLANVSQLQVYQTDNQEFYADNAPRLIGEATPTTESVEIPINNYALRNGSNLLWLTAVINPDATLADFVDAKLTRISYSHEGESKTKDIPQNIGDPDGQAQIFNVQSLAYVPTTDNCQYYRIPAMILDQNGNIVVAADRRYNSNSDLGNHKIDVSIRRSLDGGRTWSEQNIIATGDGKTQANYGYGDPALARTQSGRLICVMAAGSTMYWNGMRNAAICLSDDNGITWTRPRQLYTSHFTDAVNGKTNSLGFYANFISSGKGLTTSDGTVMFTNNCLTYENKNSPQCYILSSNDNGENWIMGPANAYAGCDESKLEQLNNGDLMVSVRQSGNRGFNTGSADATKWDTQWRNGQISGNACNADILYYSRSTNGERDIMLHSYIKSSARENLTLAMSIDQGITWHDFMNIQPGGSCYSTMQRLNDGSVAILYEDESYSVGNGYAINFVTITQEQINTFADQLKKETSNEYQKALDKLENGGVYYIATNYLNDEPYRGFYYMKADGTLTTDISLATYFTFQRKPIANGFKPIGWKSGQFTNPTNAHTNSTYIRTDQQNRDNWEAQVITCNADGLFAIRATNAPTDETWGSNAYWTTDDEGHATYDLAGAAHYIWRIIKVGTTPRFDTGKTYRIKSHLQGGFAMEQDGNGFATYYEGMNDYADDFVFQTVANEIGAFTIKNKRTNHFVSQADDKGFWTFGESAAQFRIQQIENDEEKEECFIIQAPFAQQLANLSVDCLVNPDTEMGGNFRILNCNKNGNEVLWQIMTTEEALVSRIEQPSSPTFSPLGDEQGGPLIYSIDGIRRQHPQHGLNIVRQLTNSKTRKLIIK